MCTLGREGVVVREYKEGEGGVVEEADDEIPKMPRLVVTCKRCHY